MQVNYDLNDIVDALENNEVDSNEVCYEPTFNALTKLIKAADKASDIIYGSNK